MHWDYDRKLDIQKYFGFVYCITNTKTKKAYIGCKQYWTYRKGKKKHPKPVSVSALDDKTSSIFGGPLRRL